jgi:drug/metabolite transporter (DMT)-like permease
MSDTALSRPHRLTLSTLALLTLPQILWAGNAVVGRLVVDLVPPLMFNFLRWSLASLLLLPLAAWVLRPGSGLWAQRWRFAWLSLFSVGAYNALQYMALQTSSPINMTLVGSSMPIWMQLVGRVFFKEPVSRRQMAGSLLSIAGVVLVLSRGSLDTLRNFHLLPGDFYILMATICWAVYSWMLVRPQGEPQAIRSNWAAFLFAQTLYGSVWAGMFAVGETALSDHAIVWGWPLAAALLYVVIGPAILAYRAWGAAVQRAGPTIASFFICFIPFFTALLSALLLGEMPQLYHGAAFILLVGGIVVASKR